MTSLVTGGNGFIGQALVRELLERGEEVVVFDAQDRAEQLDSLDKKVMFVQGDLAELSDVSSVVKQYRPQTIFHLGAMISLAAEAAPQRAFWVNLGGTFNLLEAVRLFDVETLVYASTVAVYGEGVESPVADDAPQLPSSVYGATKVASERWAEQHHRLYGTNVRGIRWADIAKANCVWGKPASADAAAARTWCSTSKKAAPSQNAPTKE